jgi:hypothetical protein
LLAVTGRDEHFTCHFDELFGKTDIAAMSFANAPV